MLILLLAACTSMSGELVRSDVSDADDDVDVIDEGDVSCLTESQVETLDAHLANLTLAAASLPSTPSADTIPMFFEFPGGTAGPPYTLDLTTACPDGEIGGPYCDDLVCYTPTCTAEGGWQVLANNVPNPDGVTTTTETGWALSAVQQTVSWSPAATSYTIGWQAGRIESSTGEDWTFTGAGIIGEGLTLAESFPYLSAYGELTVDIVDGAGSVAIATIQAATWDGTTLDATDCPQ